MKILGIELKASEAILIMVEVESENVILSELKPKKLKLNSDQTSDVKTFVQTFNAVIQGNGIDKIAIKSRNKKGDRAGGAVGFKIEGIIQAVSEVQVNLIAPQTIASVIRNNKVFVPDSLSKYQETAYEVAFATAKQ